MELYQSWASGAVSRLKNKGTSYHVWYLKDEKAKISKLRDSLLSSLVSNSKAAMLTRDAKGLRQFLGRFGQDAIQCFTDMYSSKIELNYVRARYFLSRLVQRRKSGDLEDLDWDFGLALYVAIVSFWLEEEIDLSIKRYKSKAIIPRYALSETEFLSWKYGGILNYMETLPYMSVNDYTTTLVVNPMLSCVSLGIMGNTLSTSVNDFRDNLLIYEDAVSGSLAGLDGALVPEIQKHLQIGGMYHNSAFRLWFEKYLEPLCYSIMGNIRTLESEGVIDEDSVYISWMGYEGVGIYHSRGLDVGLLIPLELRQSVLSLEKGCLFEDLLRLPNHI